VVTKTRGGAPTRAPSRAAKKPVTRSKRAKPSRPPFWRVQARDLWAVGLITLGVLLALALWGKQLGPIGHAVDSGLGLLAGADLLSAVSLLDGAGLLSGAGLLEGEGLLSKAGLLSGAGVLSGAGLLA